MIARLYSDRYLRVVVLINELLLLTALMLLIGYIRWGYTPAALLEQGLARTYAHIIVNTLLCYTICCWPVGIVIHHRFVRSHHILRRVLLTLTYFIILTLIIHSTLYIPLIDTRFLLSIYTGLIFLVLLNRWVLRQIIRYIHNRGINLQRVIFLGDITNAEKMWQEMQDRSEGFHLVGYFHDQPIEELADEVNYLGTLDEVIPYLTDHPRRINEIYSVLPTDRDNEVEPIVRYSENNLLHFFTIPFNHSFQHRSVSVDVLGGTVALSLRYEPLTRWENRFVKRAVDFITALVVLLTIFPILYVVCAIGIKLSSPGPVLFRQRRTGFNGRDFWLYKFRSMHLNPEADTLQAQPNDPRAFAFGRFIRRTNIDEFPQFINVLFGHMSLVGPRPHMLSQTDYYRQALSGYMIRHFIKPGITGWAQVCGFRGETTELWKMEGRLKKDIWYIEHWSIPLDIYIFFRTILLLFQGDKNAI